MIRIRKVNITQNQLKSCAQAALKATYYQSKKLYKNFIKNHGKAFTKKKP